MGMKKSIPIIREWESEAFILGNGGGRDFPLAPGEGGVEVIWTKSKRTATFFRETVPKIVLTLRHISFEMFR